jgi:hypothetical protein
MGPELPFIADVAATSCSVAAALYDVAAALSDGYGAIVNESSGFTKP